MINDIDNKLCNGCGKCYDACAADVLRIDRKTRKAKIVYPKDCTMCRACQMACPQQAIYISIDEYYPYPTSFGV